jgi:leader peptidase (prepilin peptidase)/N-methyltransferase
MDVAAALFVFAPALAVGSFLNVVAARLPDRRSLVRPASACPGCGAAIARRDNVPLLSWLLLRGRCRSCATPISARYPAVELATALLVAACFATFGLSGEAVVASLFVTVLVVLSAIDVERRILPDRIVLPATALVLAGRTALDPAGAPEHLLAAIAASLFLFVALLAYPRGMGMGDVKLALLLGVGLGREVAVALLVGMAAALVVGAAILVRDGLAARKTAIPFGPFLAFGAVVALFAGERLMDAYLALFGL